MIPNIHSPNEHYMMLAVHTAVIQGSRAKSCWVSMIVTPGDRKQQTETQTESNWSSVTLIASLRRQHPCHPTCIPSNLGYWASCSLGYPCIFPIHSSFFFSLKKKERKEVVKDINSMDTWLCTKPLSVTLWDRQGRDLFPCSVRDYRSQTYVLWPRWSVTGHVELKSQT